MRIGICGFNVLGRRCGQPAHVVRDLGPGYAGPRVQPICQIHAQVIASADRPTYAQTPGPTPPGG